MRYRKKRLVLTIFRSSAPTAMKTKVMLSNRTPIYWLSTLRTNFYFFHFTVIRRFHEHKAHYHSNWMNGTKKIPRRMVFIENSYKNRQSAEIRELEIKKKGRIYKEKLIEVFRKKNPPLADYLDNYSSRYV
jgi:predicted GIY-YIG superfamily endonuclease